MEEKAPEIAICVDGESALVAGDPTAIAELFRVIDVPETSTSKLGSAVADMLAAASGLAGAKEAGPSALSGNAFTMTSESFQRYIELAGQTASKPGVVAGLARTSDGRIDTVLEFVKTSPLKSLAGGNLPVLAACLAIRTAIHSLETLMESVDAKVDVLIRDNRHEAMGNIQGTTQILDKAFGYFEETGTITSTLWDQVAGQAVSLAQAHAVALNHIDSLTDELDAKDFSVRLANAKKAANGDLQHWLIITAVTLTNAVRLDSLEIVHAETTLKDTAHVKHVFAAKDTRLEMTRSKLQRLADVAAKAVNVSALTRVANPIDMPKLYGAVEELQRLLAVFAANFGMPEMSAVERSKWNQSVLSLGQQAGQAVAGAVTAAAGGVAAAPKAIGGGIEDRILQVAQGIEGRRNAHAENDPASADSVVEKG
ncbi:hypothetical protein [Paenarthrobacter aurescens]|uniref:Uncharacterized protein n=1 Tax=Paenarthrobacter aurescens TaxID=43663 RepID=A0A4Y3NPB8_PAEAU|nr:hypothetical protein [Paenarthrobacter aurescens]MDO6145205.1 hypothetical protein [Paenarthrobacter aurescens]MDO6149050.1 hypothetical protein [Paenarthrobacter aurescens]MDO6160296.1 hypothetical protein [Paenarthrobacter aurescens]MDO6164155.1 hypothetical protein [Paenarthrobacter aurescens]GEB20858.1 hypothetical protein AAU01_36130 [Paenarthrobacter aurescens]